MIQYDCACVSAVWKSFTPGVSSPLSCAAQTRFLLSQRKGSEVENRSPPSYAEAKKWHITDASHPVGAEPMAPTFFAFSTACHVQPGV